MDARQEKGWKDNFFKGRMIVKKTKVLIHALLAYVSYVYRFLENDDEFFCHLFFFCFFSVMVLLSN